MLLALSGWIYLLGAVLAAVALYLLWIRRRARAERIVAIVLLLRRPKPLDAAVMRHVIERALKVQIPPTTGDSFELTPEGPDFVVSPPELPPLVRGGSHCLAKVGARVFLLNSLPAPYFEDRKAAADAQPDLRLRTPILEHSAWLSVDILHPDVELNMAEAYRQLAWIVADLADEDCLALYLTETERLIAYDPSIDPVLRGANPMEAFTPIDHPVQVAADDAGLTAARVEALRRLPEFIASFVQRKPGWHYSVKAPFIEGEKTEHMWVTLEAIEGAGFVGVLDNEPTHVRHLKCGDRVRLGVVVVEDWIMTDGKELVGGFSIKALEDAARSDPPT